MMDPNRFLAAVIALAGFTLIAGALLGGAYWGHVDVHAVPAKFKVGDCYRHIPPLHRWQAADGMVFDLDATDYLVVGALMMSSKHPIEPAYVGHEVYIERFDAKNEIVPCPSKW